MKAILCSFSLLVIVLLTAIVPGSDPLRAEKPEINNPQNLLKPISIKGKVTVKGSAPHSYLCLTTEDGIDYKLSGSQKDYIYKYLQQQVVKLTGVVEKQAVGPGFPAEFKIHKILSESQ